MDPVFYKICKKWQFFINTNILINVRIYTPGLYVGRLSSTWFNNQSKALLNASTGAPDFMPLLKVGTASVDAYEAQFWLSVFAAVACLYH